MGGGSLRPPPAGRPVLFPATRPVPGRPERSDHQSAANPLRGRAADLRLALLHRLVGLRLVLLPAADPQRLTRLRVLHLAALATQALHELRLAVPVVTAMSPATGELCALSGSAASAVHPAATSTSVSAATARQVIVKDLVMVVVMAPRSQAGCCTGVNELGSLLAARPLTPATPPLLPDLPACGFWWRRTNADWPTWSPRGCASTPWRWTSCTTARRHRRSSRSTTTTYWCWTVTCR